MNWAHFHLLVNDIPILGFGFATLFLIISVWGPHRDGWARAFAHDRDLISWGLGYVSKRESGARRG